MPTASHRQTTDRLGTSVKALEDRSFLGREGEIATLVQHLTDFSRPERILNIHGPGGIGKTLLLERFIRMARDAGAVCQTLNGQDLLADRDSIAREVCSALDSAEPNRPLVLALDDSDADAETERWVRESFLPQIPSHTLVLITTRRPLRGAWQASPAWRRLIRYMPLRDFGRELAEEYLRRYGVTDADVVHQIWAFTHGHPLALSLATALAQQGVRVALDATGRAAAVQYLTRCWMREVATDDLRSLVEAASTLRTFDQESLGFVVGRPLSSTRFDELTSLSFVRSGPSGWSLLETVRSIIRDDLKRRAPARYAGLWRRSLSWYRQKLGSPDSEQVRRAALQEYFYLLDTPMLRAAFFSDTSTAALGVEPAGAADLPAFRELFRHFAASVKQQPQQVRWEFLDPASHRRYSHVVTAEHLRADTGLLDLDTILDIAPESARLCKNAAGEILGFSLIIPVGPSTLPYLSGQPVSRHFFQALSAHEAGAKALRSAPASVWFYRYSAVFDPSQTAVWAALVRDLLFLTLRCDVMVTSTAVAFQQELLRQSGFTEVHSARHFDLGPDLPSATFVLDARGPRFLLFLDRLAEQAGAGPALDNTVPPSPAASVTLPDLTHREQEVARMVLAGLTNAEIAEALVVSPVTVKKHLTHIFEKTGARSRTQLVRILMGALPASAAPLRRGHVSRTKTASRGS